MALNVGVKTPKGLELFNESGLLDSKTAEIGDVHLGGYVYERIDAHACEVNAQSSLVQPKEDRCLIKIRKMKKPNNSFRSPAGRSGRGLVRVKV